MAQFADYYIRYKYDFAPMNGKIGRAIWQLFSQRIPPSFFGEGDPSEEQQQEGIPYAKVFNHRVYHLEINPNIILMQLANSFDISVEIHYENALTKNEPSCFVIIDNREGLRTVAIQNRRKAFPAPKRVAEILTEKLNRVLYGDYCYSLEILPKYYPEDLFQAWGKLQNVTRDMLFNVPDMSREEMLKRVADFKKQGRDYFDDSLMPSLLSLALAAKEGKYNQLFKVNNKDRHTAIYLDKSSVYMKNMLTLSQATNTPVELITKDGTTYRCFVESDEENTDKIVHKQLDEKLLEMLFTGKKKDGEKAEHNDILKAETEIVEMLNAMKNTSVDACEGKIE